MRDSAPPPVSGGPPAGAADARRRWLSPTALALIAANLLPLYGVLALDWEVLPLIVLFWLENIVIGVLNVARIALANPSRSAAGAGKLVLIPFFCVHYGMFTAIHGLFVFGLFGGEPYKALVDGLWTGDAAHHAIGEFSLWLPIAALATSHLFSFFWNYLGHGEYRTARPKTLMHAPYGRIVVLHVAIIGGAFLIQLLHSPLWALLLLIVLKIGLDLRAHTREHRPAPPVVE
jgi:hypothetical protein